MATPRDVELGSPASSSENSLQLDMGDPLGPQLVSLTVQAASTTAFPSAPVENDLVATVSATTTESVASSKLTDKDKLTALPGPASMGTRPTYQRGRSGSVPSRFDSLPASTHSPGRSSASGSNTPGESTPHRVSFEREPGHSLPAIFKHLGRITQPSSDPVLPTHRQTAPGTSTPPPTRGRSDSQSHRTMSPLRIWAGLPNLHRPHSHGNDPFIPRDPYKFTFNRAAMKRRREALSAIFIEFVRQAYLNALLRLPSVYFSRVARVFEDAEIGRPDIENLIERVRVADGRQNIFPSPREWRRGVEEGNVSPALGRFMESWEEFVDSLMREWKTLNVVSALLLSAIVAIFQIEDAGNDRTTRTAAFLSMTAALFSLVYGCVYILRFGNMRRLEKASRWAQEAQRATGGIFWNVWVLLATPAVWLAWSVIFFIIAMLAFLWTSGTEKSPQPPTAREALAPRVIVTAVFALGALFFVLIIRTFQSYGLSEGRKALTSSPHADPHLLGHPLSPIGTRESAAQVPLPRAPDLPPSTPQGKGDIRLSP